MSKTLTPTELQILHNTNFFEVKATATKKIEHLFAQVRDEIKEAITKNKITFPIEVDSINGKIFRGENYRGLPYLVLDYPKHFSKNSVFSFRTMFWWGNFFSFTMHLQGKALEEWRRHLAPLLLPPSGGELHEWIRSIRKKWKGCDVYICINNNPWQYHYHKENYLPIDKLSDSELKKILLEKEFIKLSRKVPLKDYKKITKFAKDSFLYLCTEMHLR